MARTAEEVTRERPTRPERVPPHNLEAEESALGSMLLSAEAIASVIEVLAPEDFYRSAHARIFRTILDLYGKGEPVDAITVTEDLKRHDVLDQVGGPLAIYRLVESVPTVGSARYYAQIVADHALLRRLIDAAARIMQTAYSIPAQPDQAADEAEGLIYAASRQREQDEVVALSSLIHASIEDLERLHERESAYVGTPTGFIDLDEKLSGLQPGNLIIVAARPGIGKSSLVTNIARNVAVDQHASVAMFSLEMSRMEIGMRLLCAEAKVPWDKIRAARVAAEDWHHIVEAAETLHQAPLYIVDSGNMTIVDIRAKARRLRSDRQIGLGLIIVDYLQLMSHQSRIENRQTEIAEISRSLKLLAKELQIPVIAVSQLNRDPERRQDKRPQLADLRESGSLEQDADIVLFIYREDSDDPQVKGTAKLIVAKNRNGPTGDIQLTFLPHLTKFGNYARVS